MIMRPVWSPKCSVSGLLATYQKKLVVLCLFLPLFIISQFTLEGRSERIRPDTQTTPTSTFVDQVLTIR